MDNNSSELPDTTSQDQMKDMSNASNLAASANKTEEDEVDYVPDDEEDSIDDEATLEEQEALENAAEIADEVAALQEEQDIPVEELMRLYGYGTTSTSTLPADSSADTASNQLNSQNSNSFSSPSSSSQIEIGAAASITHSYQKFYHPDTASGDIGAHAYNEDDEEGDGPSHEHGYFSTSDEDSENDYDYVPEESWRKDIKIGPEHQADVQDCASSAFGETYSADEIGDCMWSPRLSIVNEDSVENYLKSAYQSQLAVQNELKNASASNLEADSASTHASLKRKIDWAHADADYLLQDSHATIRDDEVALKFLYESHYDIEKALSVWKQSVLRKRKEPAADDPDRPWNEEEQTKFEEGLKVHGKNFRLIHQEFLTSRTTKELVRYYYLWKRTERHDVFVQTFRIEKRQYGLHPGATDYMDHFLDHMALVGATSSVAPGSAESFQQTEHQQNHFHGIPSHHAYLSLLPASSNARHLLSQPQKAETEEAGVAHNFNNGSDTVGVEGDAMKVHSSSDFAV